MVKFRNFYYCKVLWHKANSYKEVKMLSQFIIFVGFMIFSTANWIIRKFGDITYEQIMFHLNMPFDSETRLMLSYFKNTVMTGVIIALVLFLLFWRKYKFHIHAVDKIRDFLFAKRLPISIIWLVFCIIWFAIRMNIWAMITYRH